MVAYMENRVFKRFRNILRMRRNLTRIKELEDF
jgi:hypothetical protein